MKESESEQTCPRCGNFKDVLKPIDTGLKVALESTEGSSKLPAIVCEDCYAELSSQVSLGLKLRIEREQREKNKMILWKSRVALIRTARLHLQHKSYSEAAIAYEKYLRVLEIVFNKEKGALSPEIFNNSSRSKELSIIASTYWDLMRIYDISPQYHDRMAHSAQKLAQFVKFSPLYPDIVRKAESFQRSARNPALVRGFLKATRGHVGRCFIATAAFGSPFVAEIRVFTQFRDETLRRTRWGRRFIHFYYRTAPPIAAWLERHPPAKVPVRKALRLAAWCLKNHVEKPSKVRDFRGHA